MKKQFINLVVLVVVITPSTSFAADTGRVEDQAPAGATSTKRAEPGIQDMYRCAGGIASEIFDRDGNKLIKWQAEKGYLGETKFPPVGISAYVPSEMKPFLLTVTPDKILHTQADALNGKVQAVLNLTGKKDSDSGLPIVDKRNAASSGWFHEFAVEKDDGRNNTIEVLQKFRKAHLKSPYTEIKSRDSLTGEAAAQSMDVFRAILRARLKDVSGRLEAIYAKRQKLSMWGEPGEMLMSPDGMHTGGPRDPKDYYLDASILKDLRQGLCGCDGVFEEASAVRNRLLDESSPIRVWPRSESEARRIVAKDLSCGN